MDELRSIFAENVAALRRAAGMTQLQMAERLNYSDKAISKWERGESIPDVAMLKAVADLFSVPVDYLLEREHKKEPEVKQTIGQRIRDHGFITGISVLLVWLIATIGFVITDIVVEGTVKQWLAFVYAVPLSTVVWLVFNSIWFNKRRNFLIVSLLMWSVLAAIFVSFLVFGTNIWQVFILGVPGQFIILMWSRIRRPKPHQAQNAQDPPEK